MRINVVAGTSDINDGSERGENGIDINETIHFFSLNFCIYVHRVLAGKKWLPFEENCAGNVERKCFVYIYICERKNYVKLTAVTG
jgi:hypothetical protein